MRNIDNEKYNIDKYTYRIEWSEADNAHIGRCLEFPSLAVHAESAGMALKEINYLVEETIKLMSEEMEPVPVSFGLKKFKGNLTLRISSEMHRSLAIRSAEEGVSINQYIVSKL
ncbi:MAG TPA: toxin-antitoxin system HicB family antitoxin [Spirochaetota bacterium]|nr:toxin-antitoxin system HicB family antitoxin [Spirochaetota bacterium]HPS86390.1 toxin-antitoxin system HicB family antitoxin [Spirochaetota bacterium]